MQKVRKRKIRRMTAEESRYRTVFQLLLILLLLFPSLVWAQNQQSLNKELSLKYLHMARSQSMAAANTEFSAYDTYVENSLVFWPHNPDALYLKAKILREQGEFDRSIGYLRQSLNGTALQTVEKDEILLMYLDLSISYNRVDEALLIFSSLPADYQQKKDFLRLRCKALEIQGMKDLLLEQLERAVRLFPQDDYFNALLIRHSSAHRRRVRNQILNDPDKNKYGRLTYQELIKFSVLKAHLRRLLPLYYDRWGEDLFYDVYSLKIHSEPPETQIRSILAESESIPEDLMQVLYEATSENRLSFSELFLEFDGAILRDPDGDGVFEVREEFESGEIRRIAGNMNGDPLDEMRINFENAVPVEAAVRNSLSQEISIQYRKYPEIQSLRYPAGRETLLSLQMTPYSLRYRIDGILSTEAPAAFPLPTIETIPELHRILPQAAIVEAKQSAHALARYDRDEKRIELLHGDAAQMQADFSEGRVEERLKDPDKDGLFEIREFYQDGKLIKIHYDGNNNNIPEYIEEYGDTLLRTWDGNEDGIADYQSREELDDFPE